MKLTPEAKQIVKALKKYPEAHIHYWDDRMWSMYPSKKEFDKLYLNGDGDADLSEIEVLEGNDFDSSYAAPLTEALCHLTGHTVESI